MSLSVSVIIVSANRPRELQRCLESIFRSLQLSNTEHQVLLLLNNCKMQSIHIAKQFDQLHFEESLISLTPAKARNQLLKKCRNDWIIFIDDDAWVEDNYFKEFESLPLAHYQVVGGPNLTPIHSNTFQKISGLALESWWGSGPTSKRYRLTKDFPCTESSLILCNLAIRKNDLKNLTFPESFICGEENFLLNQLKDQKKNFFFSSKIPIWHERRGAYPGFIRQVFKYGIGRGQNARKGNFKLFHLAPAGALTVGFIFPWLMAAYLLINILVSLSLFCRRSILLREIIPLAMVFVSLHLFYTLGIFRGLILSGDSR